ncbi:MULTISPECIES: Co2+/Mg2+ efflux protein ApaG [Salinivibrio]|uniref:Protein ApaG n=2 Tax=Salinivibrio TaxID=51366 RepID=A0ABY7LB55_9GAMM|nr:MULTISPECIES: Co2+/Mg2+ efflux protein ApaG [Salinivibrio]ODP98890.1 Co2+/Mg2+ efflux protein ApaG [Salinivibrio sp. DV]OOF21332.1 Co2+/Mg2+ efflux protein ApaG [Salinivibrio sp. IB574]OOF26839.1 Co2+/Mg2+ efflux protein ApaG [Salinivibrio proteolyticus]PCE68168.1 Co2+/Mg2+ efflux protein ApaG [Salinivibrio sp. YCSC6]QCF34942.1 Co2+/Mg2+ efflux protein ApaG [Salinivibrio sp. YCSC6]
MQATDNPQFEINIATQYVEDQSEPDNERFVFSYTVTIKNQGDAPAQLMRRKWLITDANGKELEIEGEGVVGEQPSIAAGEKYTYTSGTIIETPVGVMQGFYTMQDQADNQFKVEIEPFRLALPNILH